MLPFLTLKMLFGEKIFRIKLKSSSNIRNTFPKNIQKIGKNVLKMCFCFCFKLFCLGDSLPHAGERDIQFVSGRDAVGLTGYIAAYY